MASFPNLIVGSNKKETAIHNRPLSNFAKIRTFFAYVFILANFKFPMTFISTHNFYNLFSIIAE